MPNPFRPLLQSIVRLPRWPARRGQIRRGKYTGVLLTALLLSGCSEPKLAGLSPGAGIIAFGDSLTAGYGVSAEHSYPAVLQQLSTHPVINAGVSGETTAQGLARLPDVLAQHDAELLILLEGGNDILRNLPAQQARANLAQMIELAQQEGLSVVLLGVPQKNLFSSSAPFYRELAEQYDLVFDEALIANLLRDNRYKSDSVHFNQAGYREMAQQLHQLLQDNGAL